MEHRCVNKTEVDEERVNYVCNSDSVTDLVLILGAFFVNIQQGSEVLSLL